VLRTALILFGVLLLACGCTTRYVAEIDFKTHSMHMTMADEVVVDGKPLAHETMSLIQVEKWGLRILGVIPVGAVTLRDTVGEFAEEGSGIGADAIVHIRFETYKASFPWCLLNWYTSSTVSGMGVKTKEEIKPKKKP